MGEGKWLYCPKCNKKTRVKVYEHIILQSGLKMGDEESIMSRQQCAFSKESSKYEGCGILKRNFYTRFIPIFKEFGAVPWWKMRKKQMFANVCSEKY